MSGAVTVNAPDWVTSTPSTPAVHNEPPLPYQWTSLSAEQLNALRTKLIQSLVQVVVQAVTGLFIPGGNNAATQQLEQWATSILDKLTNVENFLNFDLLNGGDLNTLAENFIQQNVQPFVRLIFGYIKPEWMPQVSLSNIGTTIENLLTSGSFQTADTLRGDGVFTWIPDGYSQPGAIRVTGDGTLKELWSGYGRNGEDAIPVSEGQQLQLSCRVRYSGLPAAGQPVVLGLSTYFNDSEMSKPVIQAVGGVSSDWIPLSGTYTVPAGVNFIRVRLALTAVATAGTVDFDSVDLHKVGLLQPTFVDGLTNLFTSFSSAIDTIFNKLTGNTGIVNVGISALEAALGDFWNLVGGKLDPTSIIDPGQISGLPGLFTQVGTVTTTVQEIAPTSGASMYRTTTAAVGRSSGTNLMPNSFFNTQEFVSDDIIIDLTAGSFKVSKAGLYTIEARTQFVASGTVIDTGQLFTLVVCRNGGAAKWGNDAVVGAFSVWSTFLIQCAVDDVIQLGYNSNASNGNTFVGEATGQKTYFAIARMNGIGDV